MQQEEVPLLRTKLDLPPPRAHTIPRERLLNLVSSLSGTRLLLLAAPAGFGKTTFLAAWCRALAAQRGAAVAWLALDQGDNDPAHFLAYLIAAVAQALGIENLPRGAIDTGSAAVLTQLVNTLAVADREAVLVLDDYQAISAPAVHAAVAFLLEHLPSRDCLVIGTRADPPLPLARLRAREQLIELRAADLRFTPDEVQAFFAANNLALAPEEVGAVDAYAEGWPAGVQLVALAQRGAPALPAGHVLGDLNRSRQPVFAYLADDVFEQQPAHLKAFLLQTAILERMCGPLCDAVLGLAPDQRSTEGLEKGCNRLHPLLPVGQRPSSDSYSRLILEELERANLFVQPLDDEQCWYRYHHLFRAFLCARLDHEPPGAVASLHRRASAWYERHQLMPSAVEHALAAADLGHAAELIESAAPTLFERGEHARLHSWLGRMPKAVLAARPALCIWAAWAALLAGEIEQAVPLCRLAECAWRATGDQPKPGELAHLQAHLARLRHDPAQTISATEQALRLAQPQGYARIFLDEGAPMRSLLAAWQLPPAQPSDGMGRQAASFSQGNVGQLLAATPGATTQERRNERWESPRSALDPQPKVLVERLSERELEVLRLIAGGASNQAIATVLTISIGTVKSHINHILGKLAAHNRTGAVAQARALGLLDT